MEAGRLRHFITIQTVAAPNTLDAAGQPVETWSTFAEVYASVEPLLGREFIAAKQEQSEIAVRMRLRYLNGVTSKMRVSFNGMLYDIKTVINYREQKRETHLMCKEGVNNG